MAPFADRCVGPTWFRNRLLAVTPFADAMPNFVWATFLTPTLLSSRIEICIVGFGFIVFVLVETETQGEANVEGLFNVGGAKKEVDI